MKTYQSSINGTNGSRVFVNSNRSVLPVALHQKGGGDGSTPDFMFSPMLLNKPTASSLIYGSKWRATFWCLLWWRSLEWPRLITWPSLGWSSAQRWWLRVWQRLSPVNFASKFNLPPSIRTQWPSCVGSIPRNADTRPMWETILAKFFERRHRSSGAMYLDDSTLPTSSAEDCWQLT